MENPPAKKQSPYMRAAMAVGGLILLVIGGLQMFNGFSELSGGNHQQEVKDNVKKALDSMVEFKNQDFLMKYPSSWTKQPVTDPTLLKVNTMDGEAACIVMVDALEPGTTLDKYAAMNKEQMDATLAQTAKGAPKMKVESVQDIDLHGIPGKQFTMTMEQEGKPKMSNRPVLFVVGNSGYSITLASIGEYSPDFANVFNAIRDSIGPASATATAK